jgi:predicted metal-dependent hydrolase
VNITVHGVEIPIEFTRCVRARRLSIRIGADLVAKVTLPQRTSEQTAREFLMNQSRWLYRAYHSMRRRSLKSVPERMRFCDGGQVVFLGKKYGLKFKPLLEGVSDVVVSGDTIQVSFVTRGTTGVASAKKVYDMWIKNKAREIISERVVFFNAYYGFTYRRISFKNLKSRWGSCSSLGNLNFNYQLIHASLETIDYVVIHEICHLKEMNHSARFWSLVAKACPNYKDHRKLLRRMVS